MPYKNYVLVNFNRFHLQKPRIQGCWRIWSAAPPPAPSIRNAPYVSLNSPDSSITILLLDSWPLSVQKSSTCCTEKCFHVFEGTQNPQVYTEGLHVQQAAGRSHILYIGGILNPSFKRLWTQERAFWQRSKCEAALYINLSSADIRTNGDMRTPYLKSVLLF